MHFQSGAAVFYYTFPIEEVETFSSQRILPEALGKVNGIDKFALAIEKGAELHNRLVLGAYRFPGDKVGDEAQGLSGVVYQVIGGNLSRYSERAI